MEDNSEREVSHRASSIKNRSDSGDNVERNPSQQPSNLLPASVVSPSQQKPPPTPSLVCSLLDAETDPEAIGSLELLLNSVVKIFCTSTPYDFHTPWKVKNQRSSTSSGFIIEGKRILSNAHGASNCSLIHVRKHGDPKKYPGRILHIAHECDLVILTVDDEKFWKNVAPLELSGRVPRLQESITVVGYPIGGDDLSVTEGVVSRVCMTTYTHSLTYLLAVQIDAAINPGNSGGPAIQGRQVLGVSFQGMKSAQSVGYIIPVPIINHLLRDILKHGRYTGFPNMAINYQFMEHESHRRYLQLNDNQHGILVKSVGPASILSRVLQKDDVITHIDKVPIADNGTIAFRRGERLDFNHLEKSKYVGDIVTFTVIRRMEELTLTSSLDSNPALVPVHSHDKSPEYLVYGGLVFSVLTRFYLKAWGNNWWNDAPKHLVNLASHGVLQEVEQQIVILIKILAHNVNYGINEAVEDSVLKTVNGIEIKNIKHLARIIDEISENGDDNYIRFEIEPQHCIIISCEEARQAERKILAQNAIAHARSENLRQSSVSLHDGTGDLE